MNIFKIETTDVNTDAIIEGVEYIEAKLLAVNLVK